MSTSTSENRRETRILFVSRISLGAWNPFCHLNRNLVSQLNFKYTDEYYSFKVPLSARMLSVVFKHDFWLNGVFVN